MQGLVIPYSKRYFKLFVLKKVNIHHEGHEEHEENKENYGLLLFYSNSFVSFVFFVVQKAFRVSYS